MSAPRSVTRVIQILEALSASSEPLSLADLSRSLDTPKSSMAALLRGLANADFVVLSEGAYRLGPGAFGLGSALVEARRRFPGSALVRGGLQRLAERSGETALFAVRDEGSDAMTYVDVIESRNAMRFSVSAGDRRPLYCTAGGRALLSTWSEAEVQCYLDRLEPRALTAQTETGRRELAEAISAARATGVAQTADQATEGVTGTAAVVRDASGSAIGALVIGTPSVRLAERGPELARLVLEEAAAISRSLGYRGGPA